MKHNPVKSWFDNSLKEEFDKKDKQRRSKEDVKIFYPSSSYSTKSKIANIQLLNTMLSKGFLPEWYVVMHFNDGGKSKREQRRRIDADEVKKDLWAVKQSIYTELYGKKWKKNKRRARSIWGIEYGANPERPHINLLIEDIPHSKFRFEWFLNQILPKYKVKCLWKSSAHIEPCYYDEGNIKYITKESSFSNSTIIYELTDFIK